MQASIKTDRLILELPKRDDFGALKIFEERNQEHLAKWQSKSNPRSETDYLNYLDIWEKDWLEGRSVRFYIKPKENPEQIIGLCNFTQIFQGAFQACYLGYNIDSEYEGKGLMFEALQGAIRYMFEDIQLHRIMANYMPVNRRSAKLLHRLGFTIEGYAKNYLFINDRWEDHVLTALTYEDWKSGQLTIL